ncbi:MAG: triose-phosphate isomerase [Thermoanaerobaculia bacterium]|nr:triose-phosphate isomerase [Thermoanaerobaculia bacterium]
MKSIVAANWKMNLPEEGVDGWVGSVLDWPAEDRLEIVVAAPYPFLPKIAGSIGGRSVRLAAQNTSEHASGAFTGEVSATMLKEVGCTDVVIGHSERRQIFGESNDLVGTKLQRVIGAGLRPIVCVGETKEIRDRGKTIEHVDAQLKSALGRTSGSTPLVVAYEPVWAIGTGENATTMQIEEAHGAIGKILTDLGFENVPILYGGSVKPHNAPELAEAEGVDGFLVGGASLSAESFRAIRDAVAAAI